MRDDLKSLKKSALIGAILDTFTIVISILLIVLLLSSCVSTRYPIQEYKAVVVEKLKPSTCNSGNLIYWYVVKEFGDPDLQTVGHYNEDKYNVGDTVTYNRSYIPAK